MKQKLPLSRQGLLDMSAIIWAGVLAGEDKEFGRKVPNPNGKLDANGKPKMVQVNSWQHGYWNAMESVLAFMRQYQLVPRDLILVLDGQDSKRLRRSIYPNYKSGGDHLPEQKVEFDKALQEVKAQLLSVGASCCQQQYREADDVIGYLAQNLQVPVAIRSVDNDLAVLQGPNVTTFIGTSGNSNENYNRYGVWPARYITLYKALVGDPSDTYPGVKGFGDTSFQKLYAQYEEAGLDMLVELIEKRELNRLEEDVADAPYLKSILADPEGAYTCWSLARLMPEKVNTGRCPLQWEVGMVKPYRKDWTDERLAQWAGHMTLVHAGNYAAAYRAAAGRVGETPWVALDIETDTPPESKEWIAEKNRARGEEDDGKGVDVFGSELVSLGLTFGDNGQFTVYLTHDHAPTDEIKNVSSEQVRGFVELFASDDRPTVIQNTLFELPVLHNEWGAAWADNGWRGFIPNVLDTAIEASYVNENRPAGLKQSSLHYLGYQQATYQETTQGRGMRELTAREAFGYGADDPICTAALHQHYARIMLIEETWNAYTQVEISPLYLTAQAFNRGQKLSLERMLELERIDLAAREESWKTLRDYLIAHGWEGTALPTYGTDITPAQIKEAFRIVTGEDLTTQVRTSNKFPDLVEQAGYPDLAAAVATAVGGNCSLLNAMVKARFSGEPDINLDSPKQVQRLLYETMKLPMRLRNRPTDGMRKSIPDLKRQLREAKAAGDDAEVARVSGKLDVAQNGNPMTDDTAVDFALAFDIEDRPELRPVLKAFAAIKIADTRSKLYYRPYRHMLHWKDGLLHTSIRQCATVTRRHTAADPNVQQMGKRPRGSDIPRIRETVIPHCDDAVVVSIDFKAQEIVSGAWQSQDPNMLDCFLGEKKKDLHILTGVGILNRKPARDLWEYLGTGTPPEGSEFEAAAQAWKTVGYEEFEAQLHDKSARYHKVAKAVRNVIAKPVNFGGMYDIQAKKLSYQLIDTEENCQTYLDAKYEAFPGYERWKEQVRNDLSRDGYTVTLMGARRHLADEIFGGDGFTRSRAERQGPNFKIQGSCGEQTRLAMGRIWERGTFHKYNARFYFPVHDELVFSVHRNDALECIKEVHWAMSQKYATQDLPAVASISLGANYREQIECGDDYDAEAIKEAIQQVFEGAAA